MGRIKDLDAVGVTDLYSYNVGYQDAEDRIIKLLESRKQHTALVAIDPSAKVMNLQIDLTIALIKGENK
jgi:hypothetical protein